MKIIVDGITIEYSNKLESRKSEIIEFAKLMCENSVIKHVKIWGTKRHDLAGAYLSRGNRGVKQ